MISWSLSAEFFSIIILSILILSFHDRRWGSSPQSRLFHVCLWLSAASVGLNILCVFTISRASSFPLWANILLNSAYFLMTVLVSVLISHSIFSLIYEHVDKKNGLALLRALLAFFYIAYCILVILNVRTGVIFYFDAHRLYRRGPLINFGYVIVMAEILLVVLCMLRHLKSIDRSMRRVLWIIPPAIFLQVLYQIAFPNILLNGSIVVTADMILLLNFQTRRLEQDSLTSIGNRAGFYHELSAQINSHRQFQVIVMAIRHFGSVNQRYGHSNGDALLYKAALWLDHFDKKGCAFRLGSVAFAILLPYEDAASSQANLQKITERFQKPWELGPVNIQLTAQFAELIYTGQDWDATSILEFLRYGLSLAAEAPSGCIPFQEGIYEQMELHQDVLSLMRRSIKEGRFQVWYQPLYNCRTHSFTSAEALLRLPGDDGSWIPPSLFIPLAEEHGLIDDLHQIVLEQVCRFLGSRSLPELSSVSINLSMQQFSSPDLIARIVDCAERFHVSPSQLKLEITERMLSENPDRMRASMRSLYLLGFHFYLDDFGTGYSNLSTLLDCPFSCIKLDQSLIREYPADRRSKAILDSMLKLFHALGLQVVTEGVETSAQAQALREKGTDWIQGYYYARPMPEDKLLPFIRGASNPLSPEGAS